MTKTTKTLLTLFFAFFFFHLQAQKPANQQELLQKYSDYFALNREAVYLHLNKTTVAYGESVWYAAYVFLPKFKAPSYPTTNLHVNLYNSEGNLMEAQTVHIQNGKGTGYFELDSLYTPGKYMVRASTKYMDNFQEELSFSQSITILGTENAASTARKYDLQLLPEGGHLVAHLTTTVGVKLIDNSGKGVFFTNGKVLNGKNETINTFKSNRFGLSKFRLTPKPGETYKVALTTEYGKEIEKVLPNPETLGMSLTANTLLPTGMVFSLNTNPATKNKIKNKPFLLAIHQNGRMKAFELAFSGKSLKTDLSVPNTEFYPGTNIITVLNQKMEPVLERLVFNRNGLKRKKVAAFHKTTQRDSLLLGLFTKDSLGLHSLSISVLPGGTKAYRPNNGILSAFYIEPYIRGDLEEGSYYFSREIEKRRRDYDLDLLLLTQGWSKYSWKNIFRNTPAELYEPESGFTLMGSINGRNKKKENQLFLKSQKNDLFAVLELQSDGSFKLENVFLKDSTSIGFGLLNERNNKTSKPSIYLRVLPAKDQNHLKNTKIVKGVFEASSGKNEEAPILPTNFLESAVALETILLEATVEEEEEGEPLYTGLAQKTEITENLAKTYFYITDLIRSKGFRVKKTTFSVSITSSRAMNLNGSFSPTIYINGTRISDFSWLLNMKTSDVKTIYVNKGGIGHGLDGAGGVIHIETRTDFSTTNQKETTGVAIAENGFAITKEFYAPKYRSYTTPAFEKYGAIDWFPNLTLDQNGKTKIKIFNTLQPYLKLLVSGITTEGALISEEITVEVDQ